MATSVSPVVEGLCGGLVSIYPHPPTLYVGTKLSMPPRETPPSSISRAISRRPFRML
jgi:hypothetical protein